jgi:hypothetical protein
MASSMDLPVKDLIAIKEDQVHQHKVNYQALKSTYQVHQELLPPVPAKDMEGIVENMKKSQQAVEILERHIEKLKLVENQSSDKPSISA